MSSSTYQIISISGSTVDVKPAGLYATLDELQKAVDGNIELVRPVKTKGMVMIVNEEGLLRGLPVNPRASALAGRNIVGTVVVMPKKMLE